MAQNEVKATQRKPVHVRSNDGLGLGFVANRFNVVPVRTNDEGCIVVRVVVGTQARGTVVFTTRFQSHAIEGLDLLAILGRERQVKMRWLLVGLVETQLNLTIWAAKLDALRRPLRHNSDAERCEYLEEEPSARCIVADSEFHMVKHAVSCVCLCTGPNVQAHRRAAIDARTMTCRVRHVR